MGFTLRDYADLKIKLDRQIIALCGSHKAPSEDKLPAHRKYQVEFLRKCELLLDAPVDDSNLKSMEEAEKNKIIRSRELEKSRTLSGLMLIIKHEIDHSHLFKTGDNGIFSNGLVEAIGVSEENPMDANSAANLVGAAMKFLVTHAYQKGDTTKPLLVDHPFSKIENFDFVKFWDRGTDMQNVFRKQVVKESEAERQKVIADQKEVSSGGMFSFWWWGSAKQEEKKSELEVDFKATETTNSMK